MLDFLQSFIDKIGFVIELIVSLPSTLSSIFHVLSLPFTFIFDSFIGELIFSLLVALVSFLIIYSIVKLVLSLL